MGLQKGFHGGNDRHPAKRRFQSFDVLFRGRESADSYDRWRQKGDGALHLGDGVTADATDFHWANLSEPIVGGGQANLSRNGTFSSTGASLGSSGDMYFTFWQACRTEVVGTAGTSTGTFTPSGTPTVVRYGLYTVDASGNLTLAANTAHDATVLAASGTNYTKALASSYRLVRGAWYADAWLIVTAGTMALLVGRAIAGDLGGFRTEMARGPRLAANITGQSDLPASVAVGSLVNRCLQHYSVLLP